MRPGKTKAVGGRSKQAGPPRISRSRAVSTLRECRIYAKYCESEGKDILQGPKSRFGSGQEPVIAVTSLALEARIARGRGVTVLCDHASHLVASLEEAIGRGAAGIISFGVAGGLARHLVPGDLVVASGVWTTEAYLPVDEMWVRRLLAALPGAVHADIAGSDALLVHPGQKRGLHACSGAVVADMESQIAARIAAEHRIPFAACRVVIDPVDERLPPAAEVGLREDGKADVMAVLASLARQPGQLPALVRIAYHAAIAGAALRECRRSLGAALGCPHFSAEVDPPRSVTEGERRTARSSRSGRSVVEGV
jgi:adenosylhomocysteine nucleosidase